MTTGAESDDTVDYMWFSNKEIPEFCFPIKISGISHSLPHSNEQTNISIHDVSKVNICLGV